MATSRYSSKGVFRRRWRQPPPRKKMLAVATNSLLRLTSSSSGEDANGVSMSISPPSGLKAGDLWVIVAAADIDPGSTFGDITDFTNATGTLVPVPTNGYPAIKVFWKIAVGGETAVTLTHDGGDYYGSWASLSFVNYNPSDPIGNISTVLNGSGTTIDTPAVTMQANDSVALMCLAAFTPNLSGVLDLAHPSGSTPVYDDPSTTNQFLALNVAVQDADSGSFTANDWTSDNSIESCIGVVLEIRPASGVGGASEALAGAPSGVSTVAGAIQVARQLAAVSAGVSTAAGEIDISRTLAATSAGVSTVAGAMNVARSLAAASNAVSTTAGNILVTKTLAATSAGVSTVSGNMIVARQLSATSAGVSTASGSLTRSLACAGTIAGVASVAGNIIVARQLATIVAGVSTVTGALSNIKTLTATVAAVSATSGEIDVARTLAAASNGVSTVAGAMSVARSLAAASAGVSAVSGNLSTDTDVTLSAATAAVSSVSGSMNVARSLSVTSAGISSVSGNTNISKAIAATSSGVSTVVGSILVARSLTAQVSGVSSLAGNLITGETPVAGIVAGVSNIAGTISIARKLVAVSTGASSVSGAVNLSKKVSAVVAGVSGVAGIVKVARRLSSVSSGVSGVSGDLNVVGDTENLYETLVLNTQAGSILGFWRLNEGASATTAIDSSPAGQDSVALSGISFGNPSLLGGDDTNECALFPGTASGYIRLENNINSGPLKASQFTITGWFKMPSGAFGTATSTGTGGISAIPLVTKGRSETDSVGFNVNYFMGIATNKLAADFESSSGTNHPIIGGTTLVANRWYFGAITYDGANLRLYLNGTSDASSIATSDVPDITTAQPACIGSAMTTAAVAAGGFNGYIDEVAIWNTALTSGQILALWNTGRVTKTLQASCIGVSGVSGGVLLSSGLVDIEGFNLSTDRTGNFGLSRSGNKTFNLKK